MAVLAPASDRLMIKLLVPPDVISQVRTGQKASLRVASCPTAEFGVLTARVLSVGADTQTQRAADGGAGASAYEVLVQPKSNSLSGRKETCQLRLGMQITGDIVTRRTTVLGFLLNKLRIQG
jgi:multidrug efflux pump subunit AcrA (membrane-fusion protein)